MGLSTRRFGWFAGELLTWLCLLEWDLRGCHAYGRSALQTSPVVNPTNLVVRNQWMHSPQMAALQPPARASHAATAVLFSADNDTVRETMLVFGGVTSNDVPLDTESWLYQPVYNAWLVLQGSSPPVRFGHTMLTGPSGDYALLIGGCCLDRSSPDDIAEDQGQTEIYMFRDMTWRLIATNQSGFHNRFLHSAVVLPHFRSNATSRWDTAQASRESMRQLLIFGGAYCVEQEGDEVNDLWLLSYNDDQLTAAGTDLESGFPPLKWEKVQVTGRAPRQRAGHVGVSTLMNTMLVFGGYSNATMLRDLWEFDPDEEKWSVLPSLPENDISMCTSVTGVYWDDVEALVVAMACSCTPSLVTWIYLHKERVWQKLSPLGLQRPGSLAFPSLTIVDQQLLLYGGRRNDGVTNSEVWVLVRQDNVSVWAVQPTPQRLPPPRALHAAAFCPIVGAMFIIGGFAVEATSNGGVQGPVLTDNIMWQWNASWDRWTQQPVPLSFQARVASAMDIVNGVLVVFGGFDSDMSALNDTWRVTTVNMRWQRTKSAFTPSARGSHSIVSTDTDVIMFGGFNTATEEAFNDVCVYSVAQDTWSCDSCTGRAGTCIKARFGHSAAIVDTDMYVFGGVVPEGGIYPDNKLWRYSLRNKIWQIAAGNQPSRKPSASSRFFFSMTAVGSKLVILGGCSVYDAITTSVAEWYTTLPVFCFQTRSELDAAYVFDTTQRTDGEWSFPLALSNPPPMYMQSTTVVFHDVLIVYGGIGYQYQYNDSTGNDERWLVLPGCNAGSASRSFPLASCEECDRNSYAQHAGMTSCTKCPAGTFADMNQSVSVKNCSLCDAQRTCFGHGRCVVGAGYRLSCVCHFGYSPSDKCQLPIYYIIGAGVAVILIIAFLLTVVIIKYRRKKRAEEHKEHMLACSRQEIAELTTVWRIDPEELSMKHRIDHTPGSFGQVRRIIEHCEKAERVKQLCRS